jgi:hypothetical protein
LYQPPRDTNNVNVSIKRRKAISKVNKMTLFKLLSNLSMHLM